MTRPYQMTARAEAVREREEAVLEEAFDAFLSEYYDQVTLRGVAERAGVTEQTVIRRFGSKEELLETVLERLGHRFAGPRGGAETGDYRQAITEAVESYEQQGQRILHLLSQEDRTPALARVTEVGRAAHRQLTAEVFAPWLPDSDDPDYPRELGPFVVALDLYTWKLLRLDLGLSRAGTELAITRMVEGLIHESRNREQGGQ